MSQRIFLLIHDLSRDPKSKQINNFIRNTGGGNSHGCELGKCSWFLWSIISPDTLLLHNYSCDRFRTSSHVELDKDAVKLQIQILQETHSIWSQPLSQMPEGNVASKNCCLTKVIMFVSAGKLIPLVSMTVDMVESYWSSSKQHFQTFTVCSNSSLCLTFYLNSLNELELLEITLRINSNWANVALAETNISKQKN